MRGIPLIVDVILLTFPLALPSGRKNCFKINAFSFFLSLFLISFIFLIWAQLFAFWNIWDFNHYAVTGFNIGSLPYEVFFLLILLPYAFIQVFEQFRSYAWAGRFEKTYYWISLLIVGGSASILFWYYDRLFTALCGLGLLTLMLMHLFVFRRVYLGSFYMIFAMSILPLYLIILGFEGTGALHIDSGETTGLNLLGVTPAMLIFCFTQLLLSVGYYEGMKRLRLRYRLRHPKQQTSSESLNSP
jgi:hypothetical protein